MSQTGSQQDPIIVSESEEDIKTQPAQPSKQSVESGVLKGPVKRTREEDLSSIADVVSEFRRLFREKTAREELKKREKLKRATSVE